MDPRTVNDTGGRGGGGHDDVPARAERRWTWVVAGVIGLLMLMIAFASVHWIMMPPSRVEVINPSTLHLSGEFIEDNLGSAAEPDGSVTVRVVGQQYSFTPQCIVVPADTPVTIRGTSADVIHGFIINGTNVNVMLEPGYVSTFRTRFDKQGEMTMPCHEYCSVGHAGMWARVKVVDRASFFDKARQARRQSCVQ